MVHVVELLTRANSMMQSEPEAVTDTPSLLFTSCTHCPEPTVVLATAGATEVPTGTTDGVSASRNTVRVPSQNFSGFLTVLSV
jgi:hypothetical protein